MQKNKSHTVAVGYDFTNLNPPEVSRAQMRLRLSLVIARGLLADILPDPFRIALVDDNTAGPQGDGDDDKRLAMVERFMDALATVASAGTQFCDVKTTALLAAAMAIEDRLVGT